MSLFRPPAWADGRDGVGLAGANVLFGCNICERSGMSVRTMSVLSLTGRPENPFGCRVFSVRRLKCLFVKSSTPSLTPDARDISYEGVGEVTLDCRDVKCGLKTSMKCFFFTDWRESAEQNAMIRSEGHRSSVVKEEVLQPAVAYICV